MGATQLVIHEPTQHSFRQVTLTKIDIATSGDNTIITPSSSAELRILFLSFVCNAAVNIILNEGTVAEGQAALTGVMNMLANGSITWDFPSVAYALPFARNKSFVINLSAAKQVSGLMMSYEVQG